MRPFPYSLLFAYLITSAAAAQDVRERSDLGLMQRQIIAIEMLANRAAGNLPERLNRDPAVLRGLTNDEMWVALIVGAGLGVILGTPLAVATASIATLPTCMFICMALVTCSSRNLVVPEPAVAPGAALGCRHSSVDLHSGPWTVRRTRRHARATP